MASDRRAVLESIDRSVRREAHNLVSWPQMTWQQLYNRLQWDEGATELLQAQAEGHAERDPAPWAHVTAPYPESSALVRTLSGHDFWVMDVAVSPSGDVLASASNAEVILWDLATGAIRLRLEADGACAFSPDGSIVAAGVNGIDDGMLAVFDARTGERLRTSETTKGLAVKRCAMSPDGSVVLTGHSTPYFTGGDLVAWEAATLRRLLHDMESSLDLAPVEACAVTPDGTRLLVADPHGGVRLLETRTGAPIWRRTGEDLALGKVRAAALSPDGLLVVAGGNTGRAVLLAADTGGDMFTLGDGGAAIDSCAFAPDAELVALGKEDGTVELWDATGSRRGALVGHAEGVLCCTFTPDGGLLVTGGRDRIAKVWDVALVGDEERGATGHDEGVQACVAIPDGSAFLSAGEEGLLGRWDAATGQRLGLIPQPAGRKGDPPVEPNRTHYVTEGDDRFLGGFPVPRLTDCSVGPGGSLALCVSSNKQLKTWDLRTGDQLQDWHGHDYPIYGCAVSPDGRFLLSAAADRTTRIWEAATGEEVQILEASDNLRDCAVSPDGRFVVAVGSHGSIRVWDPETAEQTKVMTVGSPDGVRTPGVEACAFAPDGSFLVTAAEQGVVSVWDLQSGAARVSLRLHEGNAAACAVTPDGAVAATAGADHTIRLWRVDDGTEVLTVPVPGPPQALALHPWLPIMAWGDSAGSVFVAELVGMRYGPIVVTPVREGRALVTTCPACRASIPTTDEGVARCTECGLEVRFSPNPREELTWDSRRARKALRRTRKRREPLQPKRSVDSPQDRLASWTGEDRR